MARWRDLPIVGGAYCDDAKPWTAQDCLNWLPVYAEKEGGRSPVKLTSVPGMVLFAVVGDGPHRGARNVEGKLFVVSGDELFQVFPDGTKSALGTIPGTDPVSMTHNQVTGGNELVIGNGSSGYVYNTKTGVFAQITDEAFPGFRSVDYIGQYVVGIEPQRRYWFHSDLADATQYISTDTYEAEASPDRLVGLIVSHRELIAMGERTGEVFTNDPVGTIAFQRATGTVIERGCASAHTLRKLDNTAFWLGENGVVYRLDGYTPVRISTHAIEQALSRCDIARALAFVWEGRGHAVYYLTLPDGQTWGYDIATQQWHRRQSQGLTRWRVSTLVNWAGDWYAGDYDNGRLYRLDWSEATEAGDEMERLRVTGVVHDSQNRIAIPALEVVAHAGPRTDGRGWPPPPDMALSGNPPDGIVGAAYSYGGWTVVEGIAPYTWALLSGSVPAGTTLDATSGVIFGTPTTEATYTFTLQATGADGRTASAAFDIAITQTLAITGDAPDGTVGQAYTYTYTTAGGTAPRTVDNASGSLPTSLSLSGAGVLSGTPTAAGTYTFEPRVTDALAATDTVADSVTIFDEVTWFATKDTDGVANYIDGFPTSANGTSWTTGTLAGAERTQPRVVAGEGRVVLYTNSGTIHYSNDGGATWTGVASAAPSSAGGYNGRYANGTFWIPGGTYGVNYSADGVTWTTVSVGSTPHVYTIAAHSSIVIAAGLYGRVRRSLDNGATWSGYVEAFPAAGADPPIFASATNGSVFVVGGGSGRMAFSSDGVAWTQITSPFSTATNVRCMAYGNGLWVAGAGDGAIAYSTNGTTWTLAADSLGGAANDVDYANGRFVMVGGGGHIKSSTNGNTWTEWNNPSAVTFAFTGVAALIGAPLA